MKKRILALALAGTTAFSMFGGLNVFAATDGYSRSNYYTELPKVTVAYTAETDDDDAIGTISGAITSVSSVVSTYDVEDAIEEGFSKSKVYLYDVFDATITKSTSKTINRAIEALEDGDAAAFAAVMNGDEEGSVELLYYGTIDGSGSAEIGDSGSFRRYLLKEYEAFLDEVPAAKYFTLGDDDYHFGNLLSDIKDTEDGDKYEKLPSSYLIFLMSSYNELIDYVDVASIDDKIADLEAKLEVLASRTEDEFKYSKDYDYFLADLKALDKALASADTFAELEDVEADITALATEYRSSGADKSELTALMKSLFRDGTIDPTYTGKKADGCLYIKTDYDTTSDEWKAFVKAYGEAYTIYHETKSKSFQTDVDIATENLETALEALDPSNGPANWQLVKLEELMSKYDDLVPTDYTNWSTASKALANAEAVLNSENPSAYKVKAAIEDLEDVTLTPASVKLSDKKALKAAITDAEKWLKNYDETATAGQILAVKNAVDSAKKLFANDTLTTLKADTLISEVLGATDAINAAMDYSAVVLGWSKNADGKWIYGTADGYLTNGWNKIGGTWYYFNADGTAKQSEWMQEDGTWYWFTANCNAARGWAKVNGEWYFFNDGCKMMTGWVKVAGSWYYLAPSGKMVTGWVEVDGKWYYLSKEANAVGQMLANTTVDGYKLGADGAWVK